MKLFKPLLTVLALPLPLSLSQLVAQVEMLVHHLVKPLPRLRTIDEIKKR